MALFQKKVLFLFGSNIFLKLIGWAVIIVILLIIILLVLYLIKKILLMSVFEAYNALLYWGASRKYPREKQEIPYEYCQRLSNHFPQQKINLKVITDCYVA